MTFKIIYVFCFILICFFFDLRNSISQTDNEIITTEETTEEGVDPVLALNKFIKQSYGKVENKLIYDGKLFGYKGGERIFIKDYLPLETFTFETLDYDSVQFYYEWEGYVVDGFFLKVLDNKPFTFEPLPVQELKGLEIEISNVKKHKGKKLYEIKINDDVSPGQIEVIPLEESLPFIDIVLIDSSTYQIKLKNAYEFSLDVSPIIQEDIVKGNEVIMPIGIKMKDKIVTTDVQEYQVFLKKIKSKKTKK